jgi:hypothetical protein
MFRFLAQVRQCIPRGFTRNGSAALRNCTRDEGRSFEGRQSGVDLKPPQAAVAKAMVVNVAEKPEQDSGRYD